LTDLPSLNTRWDARYPAEDPEVWKRPSAFLVRCLPLLSGGRALDVACGPARNAVFLAERGYVVDGVDNSREGLMMAREFIRRRNARVNLIFADLARYAVRPGGYDLIVNFFYLDRALVPLLVGGLKPGGYLVFESFTTDNRRFSPLKDPAHYLAPNELLGLIGAMRVLSYYEGTVIEAGMARCVARAVARKQ
jgi:tellurite methyltransferase